eukprot:scaffold6247_cov104-Cylindrotheca_fusiformis.AAC.3
MGVEPQYFVYTSETRPTDIPREKLTHLHVDSSVREIPEGAFESCEALVQVQIPETLTRIGKSAFRFCPELKCVYFVSRNASRNTSSISPSQEDGLIMFPEAMLQIDELAFFECKSVRKVIFCSVFTRLGKGVFSKCRGLISVQLPEGLQVIELGLFSDCELLTSVEVPPSVIKIGDYAFNACFSLASIGLPHGLLEIGKFCFEDCCLADKLRIPSTVSIIGESAFRDCSELRSIKLPPKLERIESYTFSGCNMIGYIEIPSTVSFIGFGAFYGCSSLSHIRIPPIHDSVLRLLFRRCNNLISIEIPEGRSTGDTEDEGFIGGIASCRSLVNLAIPTLPEDNAFTSRMLNNRSKLGSVADNEADLNRKLTHRFVNSPLNKLCYYHSYLSAEDTAVQLCSLMEEDPLAATTQVDEFGMTPLHILLLSQTPNVEMLLAVMKGGHLDHIIRGKDLFGSTPMDYLCLNRMPNSSEVIRLVLQTRFDCLLGLDRPWKSDMLQAVDDALAVEWSFRGREIIAIYLKLAKYERKEICSILELYLWKVKIDEISLKNEEVADRQSCRINSGASIVIPCVLPFLDILDVEDYFGRTP